RMAGGKGKVRGIQDSLALGEEVRRLVGGRPRATEDQFQDLGRQPRRRCRGKEEGGAPDRLDMRLAPETVDAEEGKCDEQPGGKKALDPEQAVPVVRGLKVALRGMGLGGKHFV